MSTNEFNQMLLNNVDFLKPFAVTLTHDAEKAKDLYQETLYRAITNQEKYKVGTNIKAWLYTIMRNIFINDYRRKAKHNVIFDATPNEFLLNSNNITVPNQAETLIEHKTILAAIKNLPEIFRVPFELYYEGYKYQDIADHLKEPLGTIKSRIHFARRLLKQFIENNGNFGLEQN
jgi:RNA polymerase sigma factor (sigma-70 family)